MDKLQNEDYYNDIFELEDSDKDSFENAGVGNRDVKNNQIFGRNN